ncbi:hypothetical protein Tco_0266153 [Tanacetum coccineum]
MRRPESSLGECPKLPKDKKPRALLEALGVLVVMKMRKKAKTENVSCSSRIKECVLESSTFSDENSSN